MSARPAPRKLKRVALIIESMMAPRRTMMNGVARYMQEHEPWSIYLKPSFVDTSIRKWIDNWDGDGVIASISSAEADSIAGIGIPLVDLTGDFPGRGYAVIRSNDREIGSSGAEHLLERGFKHFAFCELVATFWSKHRREGFETRLQADGFMSHNHLLVKPSASLRSPTDWESQQADLADWIKSLPKPLGIMATTDFMGRQVLEACQRFNIRVPDDVAVLGADNDEPICRISTPPLSSVIINDEERGYEAAALLADLMAGRKPPNMHVLISPAGIKTRASTDVFAMDDQVMVTALRYLREHTEDHTNIDELAGLVGLSRSGLERRFRRVIGRSINDEIVRLRVNLAVQLLSETQLNLPAIAARCGFSSQAYMTTVFKQHIGRTPGSFRPSH